MILPAAILFLAAFLTALLGTFLAKRYALRLGLMDAPGHRKVHTVSTPRNGGIGIFLGFALPLLVGIAVTFFLYHRLDAGSPRLNDDGVPKIPDFTLAGIPIPRELFVHLSGMHAHTPLLLTFLAATFLIHLLGLLDDRKPLSPWPKLLAQLAISAALVLVGEAVDPALGGRGGAFRILTSLGFLPSLLLSVLWITALTNAFNFLDNMDGLSGGVAFICATTFLIAALFNGQLFVAALLLTFMGAVLGFLCFNFPPASIFMGDGGSMVLGFVLSVLTIRTTYYASDHQWYAVLMPLFVMAVPLYDLTIVSALRIAKGRSPMTGDTNHFSHRLTRHGFSKRSAVLIIYAVTASTGITAPLLARVDNVSALLLAAQLLATLIIIAILERVGDHTQ